MEEELNEQSVEETDVQEEQENTTDWEAEAKKLQGINKRLKTKLEKQDKPVEEAKAETTQKKEDGLDYGQKTFISQVLKVDLQNENQMKLVQDYLDAGKSLDNLVENKHFKNDLTDLRETQSVQDATPSTSKRSSKGTKDTVDYWLAKGELPPADQVQLRRDVVNAKVKQQEQGSRFTTNPVINSVVSDQ